MDLKKEWKAQEDLKGREGGGNAVKIPVCMYCVREEWWKRNKEPPNMSKGNL